jgi:hypothetical protein
VLEATLSASVLKGLKVGKLRERELPFAHVLDERLVER